jgi:hypothetical protein
VMVRELPLRMKLGLLKLPCRLLEPFHNLALDGYIYIYLISICEQGNLFLLYFFSSRPFHGWILIQLFDC